LKYTNTKLIQEKASRNFKKHIFENIYPGRGIVIGRNQNESWILLYWIMGRSSKSRNRIFKYEKGIVRTEPADPSQIKNSNLLIYNVMLDVDDKIIVANGSHSDTIFEGLKKGKSFYKTLKMEAHEPDKPIYTPRISGIIDNSESSITLAKICKSDFSEEFSKYNFSYYNYVKPGFGYCLTTYMGEGDPPPNFLGEPILIPLKGNATEIANTFWEKLNPENRISLFTRELIKSGEDKLIIINRFGETG